MPDEVAASHERRQIIINGARSTKKHAQRMRDQLGREKIPAYGLPRLHLIALTSGIDPKAYAVSHSMLGAHRVAGLTNEIFEHGSSRAIAFSRRFGMRIPKTGVCVCTSCIREDLASSGLSWYRRAHQLFGVDWCHRHSEPLHMVNATNAFDQLPHHWQSTRRIVPVIPKVSTVETTDIPKRYFEIAMGLLKQKAPLPCSEINTRIGEEMKRHGLLVSRNGQRPYLRNREDDSSTSQWIQRLLHGSRLDHFVHAFSAPASGFVYALALALIFRTSSEAIDFIGEISAGLRTHSPESADEGPNSVTPRHRQSPPAHLSTYQSLSVATDDSELRPSQLVHSVTEADLPSSDSLDTRGIWNAFRKFANGDSIRKACNDENVEPAQLEEFIRTYLAKGTHTAQRVA